MVGQMFPYSKLQSLNDLETVIYNYVNKHSRAVESMTIRELADHAHVSTTTILRFANKMGYDGYAELRFALKQHRRNQQQTESNDSYDITVPLADFFSKVNSTDFGKLIDQAMTLIDAAPMVLFFGIGTGASLSQYGARFWSNAGKLALPVPDPFQPFTGGTPFPKGTVVVVLSVSGETAEVIEFVSRVQPEGAKIIAVTNHDRSTLAKMSDLTISYYMPELKHGSLNLTTQIPIVYLIEMIAHRLDDERDNG
ncbi:helix-turn-helix domain, rpiR family protein [Lacticaseibacillus pantheris DSM 15945 = JCM 12539 = NBRC 106106]|jgi:DNA-binding MurR/RpiR family transcriptional regulator|uniref:Helix-turn-helix domain, rpiR family protein n=2 Tax=Lacticaseibacillus pantheris TaxID=171523 RepID=A0A0R1U4K1_9LACO|nr:helix-turn-helix domain, rpiR family protein [Lacticaseibacillus pantheris DSM 15945 = JCM 12539 = NBRC 106106]